MLSALHIWWSKANIPNYTMHCGNGGLLASRLLLMLCYTSYCMTVYIVNMNLILDSVVKSMLGHRQMTVICKRGRAFWFWPWVVFQLGTDQSKWSVRMLFIQLSGQISLSVHIQDKLCRLRINVPGAYKLTLVQKQLQHNSNLSSK